MFMHVHMGDVSSLVPLYMISSNIYYGGHVMHGPLVTGLTKSAAFHFTRSFSVAGF